MPNTLAHLGLQTLVAAPALRAGEVRWLFLGCVIPDLPWILQRALRGLAVVDLYERRLYAIAQASLAVSLFLCAALAALAARPRRVFVILAASAALHLLLDALQTKWANGVHLAAPFSWQLWNAGLFWPESPISLGLSALGLAVVGGVLLSSQRVPGAVTGERGPRVSRVAVASLLLAVTCLYRGLRDSGFLIAAGGAFLVLAAYHLSLFLLEGQELP